MSAITNFLQTELLSLSNEARRKYPEIKEAAERVINILRSYRGSDLAGELAKTDDVLRPFLLACETKHGKLVTISAGCLHKLITVHAIPESSIASLLKTLNDIINNGVEIQLKILQTVLPLLTNYHCVHGERLAQALLLCFKLQDSKIAVVNNTAAATLRQLVIFLFDKVAIEEETENVNGKEEERSNEMKSSSQDAFSLFQDLCLLTNGDTPIFLKLGSLTKTFGLELIESVLTNHYKLFRQNAEFTAILKNRVCPFIIKNFSEKLDFPQTMRLMRIVYILIKQFNDLLLMECEIFLARFVRLLEPEFPQWQRVLSMEIFRGVCVDGALIRSIYRLYDRQERSTNVFQDMINVFGRLAAEKPSAVGVGAGATLNLPSSPSNITMDSINSTNLAATEYGISLGGSTIKIQCIDQLDKLEPPTVPETYIFYLSLTCLNSVVEGLSNFVLPIFAPPLQSVSDSTAHSSQPASLAPFSSKLKLEEHPLQKDIILVCDMTNTAWPGFLAAFSFFLTATLDEPLFQSVLRSYQNITNVCGVLNLVTPRDAFLTSICKGALPSHAERSIAEANSERPGTATVTFLNEKNTACLRILMNVAQFLGQVLDGGWYLILETLQQADYLLFNNINKPSRNSPRKNTGNATMSTSGSLNTGGSSMHRSSFSSVNGVGISEAAVSLIQAQIRRLFEHAALNLDDAAYLSFTQSLCRLSAETSGVPFNVSAGSGAAAGLKGLVPRHVAKSGERLFAIDKMRDVSLSSIQRLVKVDNSAVWDLIIDHLIDTSNYINTPTAIRMQASLTIVDVVSAAISYAASQGTFSDERVQKKLLLPLSLLVSGSESSTGKTSNEDEKKFCGHPDVQKLSLEVLDKILQTSGHSLSFGWGMIFDMVRGVCSTQGSDHAVAVAAESETEDPTSLESLPSTQQSVRRVALVRVSFSCLQLICTDYLTLLVPECLRQCIYTLGAFGLEPEDLNISLTAVGLLWNVSDYIQQKRHELEAAGLENTSAEAQSISLSAAESESGNSMDVIFSKKIDAQLNARTSDVLWVLLLLQLSNLCSDIRPEVRNSANQTLFRTIGINAPQLSVDIWEICIWRVLFPLLDGVKKASSNALAKPTSSKKSATSQPMLVHHSRDSVDKQWDETKVLTLTGVVNTFHNSFGSLSNLAQFEKAWKLLLANIRDHMLTGNPEVAIAAIKAFKMLLGFPKDDVKTMETMKVIIKKLWSIAWDVWENIGQDVAREKRSSPTTDTITDTGDKGTDDISPSPGDDSKLFNQQTLVAFVSTFDDLYFVLAPEFDVEDIKKLLHVLQGITTYTYSKEYPNDVDVMSPLQTAVIDILRRLDLSQPAAADVVLMDLAESAKLAFRVDPNQPSATSAASTPYSFRHRKSASYIAFSKKAMELFVEMFRTHANTLSLYRDGVFDGIIQACGLPMQLKYDCPAGGKDGVALWKSATTNFVEVVKEGLTSVDKFGEDLSDAKFNEIWNQLVGVIEGTLLCQNFQQTLSNEDITADEEFDISFLQSIKKHVVPFIARDRVPNESIVRFVTMIREGSRLYSETGGAGDDPRTKSAQENEETTPSGTTAAVEPVVKEKLAFAFLETLFWLCSQELEGIQNRIALIAAPALLERCESVLSSYTVDRPLYGRCPFPRIRTEEITFILKHLATVRLRPGILSITDGNHPVKSHILSGANAHLFYLYPALCDTITCQDPVVIGLLRECLRKVGSGLGVC